VHTPSAQALDADPRRPGTRTRPPNGRYRAAAAREQRPRPRHAVDAPAPPLVHQAAARVVGAAVATTVGVVAFDVALTGRLSMFFDLCFILVGLCAALGVRRDGLYAVGVLPPLLLGAVVAVLAVLSPGTLTASRLEFASTWLTGLAHHGVALASAHAVVLTIVGMRAGAEPRPTTARAEGR
jgi:hypothetical protein